MDRETNTPCRKSQAFSVRPFRALPKVACPYRLWHVKSAEGAEFVRDVMRRVGADNPTELAEKLGVPWTHRDQVRKLYKWHRGESAPNFGGTLALLHLAGMLSEELGGAGVAHRSSDPLADRLAALEETGADTTLALKALTAGIRRLERRLDSGAPPATGSGSSL